MRAYIILGRDGMTPSQEMTRAPVLRREFSLQAGAQRVRFLQRLEDYMPVQASARSRDGVEHEVEANATPRNLADRFLPGASAITCLVHLARDVDVVFPNIFEPGPATVFDRLHQEEAASDGAHIPVAELQPEPLVELAERIYLLRHDQFRDPFQREDCRQEPLRFATGSWDDLTTGITSLFHAFPAVFGQVPEPKVFVYSKFDDTPVKFNVHLWSADRLLPVGNHLNDLVARVVRKNVPVGFRYVNPDPDELLARRSRFKKDSVIVPVTVAKPNVRQIQEAWADLRVRFAEQDWNGQRQLLFPVLAAAKSAASAPGESE